MYMQRTILTPFLWSIFLASEFPNVDSFRPFHSFFSSSLKCCTLMIRRNRKNVLTHRSCLICLMRWAGRCFCSKTHLSCSYLIDHSNKQADAEGVWWSANFDLKPWQEQPSDMCMCVCMCSLVRIRRVVHILFRDNRHGNFGGRAYENPNFESEIILGFVFLV